jgi:hypothetical protein
MTAAYTNRVRDSYDQVRPLIDSTVHPGYVKLDSIYSMLYIKGLDKAKPANRRALEIHLQSHPGTTALDAPGALIASVLAMQESDIADFQASDMEQSSAFSAGTTPKYTLKPDPAAKRPRMPPGVAIPGRTDHCTNCLRLTSKFYYHKTADCKRTTRVGAQAATVSKPVDEDAAWSLLASLGYVFKDPSEAPSAERVA